MDRTEAFLIAKKIKPEINYCSEWKNSFVFSYDSGNDQDGGDSAVVVPKNGSECVDFLYALTETNYLDGGAISEGSI